MVCLKTSVLAWSGSSLLTVWPMVFINGFHQVRNEVYFGFAGVAY